MNYIYRCPDCKHEHTIKADVVKSSLVEAEVPLECHGCGVKINTLFVLDDIQACIDPNDERFPTSHNMK